ncbi:hypothetical protein [Sphingopyxis indica]|uniref:hypothetical protein n=1 Tax=Sphingopyxis indica TaxID=436663 RepID=UPI0014837631|nr:hypothetical protein [Sphingopyxis indica]
MAGFFPVPERGGERRRTRLTFTELWTRAARGSPQLPAIRIGAAEDGTARATG